MRHIAAVAFIIGALAMAACGSTSAPPSQPAATTPAAPTAAAAAPATTSPAAVVIARTMRLPAIVVLTAATDPNHLLGRQGGYTSDIDAGPTYTPGDTGSIGIEVYPTTAGATRRASYLETFSGTMLGDGYDYVAGTAVLRIGSHYTPAQAHALEATFRNAAR